jgi:hypothetical protein
MPSIFIWKSNEPNTSKKTIRFYSGSNWVLEESDYSSKSYIYLEQIVISESDNSVITFNSKDMHQDWVGTELLEVTNIPYEMVKSDGYGTLEKLGDWMRFTLKRDIQFNEDNIKSEFIEIKKWINSKNKSNQSKVIPQKQEKQHHNPLDHNKIKLDFQEFLIKYNMPQTVVQNPVDTTTINSSLNKPANRVYNKNNTNTVKYSNNKRKY